MFWRSSTLILSLCVLHKANAQTEGPIIAQDPNNPCTVCFQEGEEPLLSPDPANVPFRGQTDMTCETIVASVASSASLQGSDVCKNNQLAAYQLGCCQSPPYFHCDVCPDGSDFVRSNRLEFGIATNPTCAAYEITKNAYNSPFTPGSCADTFLQRSAVDCGCPNVEKECSLCPDGQRPTDLERGDAWITGSNCEGLEYLLSIYKEDECTGLRENFGVDFAHFCSCPDYEKEDTGTCVMCEDGLSNPDFVYKATPFQITCKQGVEFAESITRENICLREMQEAIGAGCNCKNGSGPVFKASNGNNGGNGGDSATAANGLATLAVTLAIALFLNGAMA